MSATGDSGVARLVDATLLCGFRGTSAPAWLMSALERGLGGVLLFAHNLDPADSAQPARVAAQLRSARGDILVAVDEEGGIVTRLEAATGSTLPSAAQLGRIDDVGLTERVGAEIGRRALAAGMNLVLAPVADVNTNVRNPVIGTRSFGAEPGLVARHVRAEVAGLRYAGARSCAKHFPGHGDTDLDSHLALPRVDLALADVEQLHIAPFIAAIEAGVDSIMTSHIVVSAVDGRPATLSPPVLALLRDEDYDGAVVSDALDMMAIRGSVGIARGAVQALVAGVDVLCLGNGGGVAPGTPSEHGDKATIDIVRDAILGAVDNGELPISRLEEAARRSIALASPLSAHEVEPLSEAELIPRVREVITGAVGSVPDSATILDIRARASAVVDTEDGAGFDGDPFARVLGRKRIRSAAEDATTSVQDTLGPLIVLADRCEVGDTQRRAIDALCVEAPVAFSINVGAEPADPLPCAALHTWGASHLTAEAVRSVLTG